MKKSKFYSRRCERSEAIQKSGYRDLLTGLLHFARNDGVKFIFMLFWGLMGNVSWALQTDRDLPLAIKAGSADFNRTTGVNIFRGGVKLEQGTTHLDAIELIIYKNVDVQGKNEIVKIVALGTAANRAHYREIPKLGQSEFHAQAEIIEYYPKERKAILIKQAEASQDNNRFKGPRIVYDMVAQTVVSPASDQGRTSIILYPDKPPGNTMS